MALNSDIVAELNEAACAFFEQAFPGSSAAAYVASRGLSADTVQHWRLGYAPAGSVLKRHLSASGWPEATLIEAGLVTERGSDTFRDRLMLPIPDRDGKRILAFGSRRLRDDDPAVPKYLNSPETVLFHKSETLYGWPNLAEATRQGETFIVEGNIDMLALWNAGIRNVVASCGTAITAEHLFAVAEVSPRITLVLDADLAGQKATRRSLLFEGAGSLDLGMLPIPAGPNGEKRDPDDVLKGGAAAWQTLLPGRLSRWEYLWRQTLAPYAERLEEDVEARVAWKEEWAALVHSQVTSREEGSRLLRRLEKRLGLPEDVTSDEYLAELPSGKTSFDDLLLLALAADWPARQSLASFLPLGRVAGEIRDAWLRAGSANLSARLRHLAVQSAEEGEQAWAHALRRDLRPAIGGHIAELTSQALRSADPLQVTRLEREVSDLRSLLLS